MTGTTTISGGVITQDVPYTDWQCQVPIAPPVFYTGAWTVTDSTNVPIVTHTPATATHYYTIPIIVPSRTTALKGAKIKSVTVMYTLGGTVDLAADDFEINLVKVTTPADAAAPVGSVVAGDDPLDYATAYNTKAKRLTLASHTVIMTVPTADQAYIAAGEQYYVRIKFTDGGSGDLTCVLKGATVQMSVVPL
jgi:hypothetical protein